MQHQLPELPWPKEALAPYISSETIEFHYGKHHKKYVDELNKLIKGTEFEQLPLETLIKKSSGPIFNNAAQAWNHNFFWKCLGPRAGGSPTGAVAQAITQTWGSFSKFKTEFSEHAEKNFGSGWTWLVKNPNNKFSVVNTSNAENPLIDNQVPILTLDIWEHAYYIDYRNGRPDYIEAFWKLVNWDFANKNLGA